LALLLQATEPVGGSLAETPALLLAWPRPG
jgi:hypothetical protein